MELPFIQRLEDTGLRGMVRELGTWHVKFKMPVRNFSEMKSWHMDTQDWVLGEDWVKEL